MIHKEITPFVGLLIINIRISFSRSLKDRRQVVRSILDRVVRRWNVSAMDLGPSGSRSQALLAFSGVGTTVAMVNRRMNLIYAFVERLESDSEFEILSHRQEVDSYDDFSYAENQQTDPEGDLSAFRVQDQE